MGQRSMLNSVEYDILLGSIHDFPRTEDIKGTEFSHLDSYISEDAQNLKVCIYWLQDDIKRKRVINITIGNYFIPEDIEKTSIKSAKKKRR